MSLAAIAALTAGILAVCALPSLPPIWILAIVAAPALMPWRGRAVWAMAALGVLLASWEGQRYLDQRWPASRHNEEMLVRGHVLSLPEMSEAQRDERTWRFEFQPADETLPRNIRVAWYRSDVQIGGGECWDFTLKMRTPHGSLNPGGFDYEAWLFRQGIAATATVRDGRRCDDAGGFWLLRARQAITDRLNEWIPDPQARALIAALTTGDQSGLSDRDWDVFRVTGTSHLVAISGFNIAIIAGFAFFLTRWLWSASSRLCGWLPAQRAGLIGSVLFAGCYAALAGFEPPVARAWLMLMVVLFATFLNRPIGATRVLALAWLAILVLEPFAVLAPGLWLSFGAVAAIIYVSTGRLRQGGVVRAAVELQIILSLALVPLTLYFFQGAAWLGPFVNLVAVPVVTVMTPLLLIALVAAAIVPAVGVPALQVCGLTLIRMRDGLEWIAAHAPDVWIPASPSAACLLLTLLGIAMLIAPRGLPLRIAGALCLLPLMMPAQAERSADLRLALLDVGQGLSVVVQTRHHALLFDAGPAFDDGFDAGRSIVAPYLLGEGVRSLDALVLSHHDNDHAGGVPAVRKLIDVKREIGTDRGEPCRAGTRWEWDGVRFEVLHPADAHWSGNNGSCVLKVEGAFSALLPGDIEAEAERELISRDGSPIASDQRISAGRALKSDVLIAPHHGSKTSSTDAFVAAVSPQVVGYGAGWRNHFGHPRPEVRARYAAIGARQFDSGGSGAIEIAQGPKGLEVREWRRVGAHFWNAPKE